MYNKKGEEIIYSIQRDDETFEFRMFTDKEVKPICNFCDKEIEGERPYFCQRKEIWFHHDCLMAEKESHVKNILTPRHPEHSDIPITAIIVRKDEN